MTEQRQAILAALEGDTSHPTADRVYEKVKGVIPNISLGTIYRNLGLLAEEGLIIELESINGPSHYDYRTEAHYHFVCDHCGTIYDLEVPGQEGLNHLVGEETGFSVDRHTIVFHGRCTAC
ncbi:MAG: Fur family transcriptional regulator [Candidatus Bipolaricaulia bacterium]